MKKAILLLLVSATFAFASPRHNGWHSRYYPTPRVNIYYWPYYGVEIVRSPQPVIIVDNQPIVDSCKIIKIENEQKIVCLNSQGNWFIMGTLSKIK